MIKNSRAFILNKVKYSETSLILTFYTKKWGKIKCLAKGAYRKNNYNSNFNLFSINHIVFYEKTNNNLSILSKCDLIDPYNDIRKDISKIGYGTYFIELVDLATEYSDINVNLYNLLFIAFELLLDKKIEEEKASRIFEIKLLYLSGLVPRIDACLFCGGKLTQNMWFSKKLGGLLCDNCFNNDSDSIKLLRGTVLSMNRLINDGIDDLRRLQFANSVFKQIKEILKEFLNYHFGNKAKSANFLNQLEKIGC